MSVFNNLISPRTLAGAAIVGLVSAAGVFIYEKIYAEKKRAMLVREVEKLDKQVTIMQTELENLRELQKESQLLRSKQQRRVRKHKRSVSNAAAPAPDVVDASRIDYSDYTSGSEYMSVMGSDTDEFYDLHSDSEPDSSSFVNTSSINSGYDEQLLNKSEAEKGT